MGFIFLFVAGLKANCCSNDEGKNWEKLWLETDGVIVKLAVAPSNFQILYAANEKNQVFQSQDAGKTWKILR